MILSVGENANKIGNMPSSVCNVRKNIVRKNVRMVEKGTIIGLKTLSLKTYTELAGRIVATRIGVSSAAISSTAYLRPVDSKKYHNAHLFKESSINSVTVYICLDNFFSVTVI